MILLLAATIMFATDAEYPVVFVSSFNSVGGESCILLLPPPVSRKVDSKLFEKRLYVLSDPNAIVGIGRCSILTGDGSLMNCQLNLSDDVRVEIHSVVKIATDQLGHPDTTFQLSAGASDEIVGQPLQAVILSKSDVFSARYDQISTIFMKKDTDFEQNSRISVLIFDERGRKWLYSGKTDGKTLRFDKSLFPKGPY